MRPRAIAAQLIGVSATSCALWVFGTLLGNQSPVYAQDARKTRLAAKPQKEEIYIAHSVRESQVAPTEFCAQARTGFGDVLIESRFTFRSTATRGADGRMVDMNLKIVGSIHACFGRTADPATLTFNGEGVLGGFAFKGIGECLRTKSDFPERGLNVSRCFLDLSGLPDQYAGGLLTTNTMTSRKDLGTETDPPGYTQSSIATIRLWKKR